MAFLLEPCAVAGVNSHESKAGDAGDDEDEVEHPLPPCVTAGECRRPHKASIWIVSSQHKGGIKSGRRTAAVVDCRG